LRQHIDVDVRANFLELADHVMHTGPDLNLRGVCGGCDAMMCCPDAIRWRVLLSWCCECCDRGVLVASSKSSSIFSLRSCHLALLHPASQF
jgi:hypothetical protein